MPEYDFPIERAQHHLYLYRDILRGKYQPSYPTVNMEEAQKAIDELDELMDYVIDLQELLLSAMGWWLHREDGQYVIEQTVWPYEFVRRIDPSIDKEYRALEIAVNVVRKYLKEAGKYDGGE